MHSIRTFWSPELKRERAARKEDAARIGALTSDLQRAHTEKQACELHSNALNLYCTIAIALLLSCPVSGSNSVLPLFSSLLSDHI